MSAYVSKYDPATDPFWTEEPLMQTTIESPGPQFMSCMAEASGIVYGQFSPGEGWQKTQSFERDKRRYYSRARYEWRKAA